MKLWINSIGIFLNIAGVAVVYWFSPLNFHTIDGGDASTDHKAIERQVNRQNNLLRVGVCMVLSGSALQLWSNFVAD